MGAKGKYKYWLTTEGLTTLEGLARDGLTDEQIAGKIKINTATLYDWKNKYPDISNALKKGKEVVDYQVENALFRSAMEGNVTAQIFWLKNRRPDKWRDKPKEEPDGSAYAGVQALADILRSPLPDRYIKDFEK